MKIATKKENHTITIESCGETGIFQVEPMDVTETNKLLKRFTKYDKVKGIIHPDTDYFGFALAKVQKVIVDWDLQDENGSPLPCNDENKKTAYVLNPKLINDVIEQSDKISEGKFQQEETELKN